MTREAFNTLLKEKKEELGILQQDLDDTVKTYIKEVQNFATGDQVILIKDGQYWHREIADIFYEEFETDNPTGLRYEFQIPLVPYQVVDEERAVYVTPRPKRELLLYGVDFEKMILAEDYRQGLDLPVPTSESVAAEAVETE